MYCGMVQPQLAMAWWMMSGASPTFVNVKVHFCTGVLSENVPKSYVVFSNLISASFCADA